MKFGQKLAHISYYVSYTKGLLPSAEPRTWKIFLYWLTATDNQDTWSYLSSLVAVPSIHSLSTTHVAAKDTFLTQIPHLLAHILYVLFAVTYLVDTELRRQFRKH
jgi:hypothetical protein